MITAAILLKTEFPSGAGWILAIALLGTVAIYFFAALKDGISLLRASLFRSGTISHSAETNEEVAAHLQSFLYFKRLSADGKKRFIKKTLIFLSTKSIRGAEDYEPDPMIATQVAAAAAQLSFGLEDFYFPGFDTIVLFPEAFRLHEDAPLMKGGTHPAGVVYISVKDFEAGYKDPSDKLNLGLHELAHALFLEFDKMAQDDPAHIFHEYIDVADGWLARGEDSDNFLRDYAFTNRQEFFAVGVEHFFEAPQQFREELPRLYALMERLLQQDPSNVNGNYSVRTSVFDKFA